MVLAAPADLAEVAVRAVLRPPRPDAPAVAEALLAAAIPGEHYPAVAVLGADAPALSSALGLGPAHAAPNPVAAARAALCAGAPAAVVLTPTLILVLTADGPSTVDDEATDLLAATGATPTASPPTAAPDRGVVLLAANSTDDLDAATAALRPLLTGPSAAVGEKAVGSHRAAPAGRFRRVLAVDGVNDPARQFSRANLRRNTREVPTRPTPIAFAFPGLGSEHLGMGAQLARESPVFRASVARTAALAADAGHPIGAALATVPTGPGAALDLARVVAAQDGPTTPWFDSLPQAHLALFAVQLALTDTLAAAGIRPSAVLGHSLGEWTAATVAGAIDRADAVRFVAARAELVAQAPPGVTLAVANGADVLTPLLTPGMTLSADNGPHDCTASGPLDAVAALEAALAGADVVSRRLDAATAFHSQQLAPAADALADRLRDARFTAPAIPLASAVTGGWSGRPDAAYWRAQLTSPVLFRQALATVGADYPLVVEIGPGTVRPWALQTTPGSDAVRTARHAYEGVRDTDVLDRALAQLWLHGHEPTWPFDPARTEE